MIDAWTGSTPQSTEYPKVENDGIRRLIDVLRKQSTDLAEKTSNLFRTAGITITETLMTFGNNVRVEGNLQSTGSASFAGAMGVGGTMNVTGDATFSGDLAVPNGSITNSALQSPVSFDATSGGATSLSISTVEQTAVTLTLTVPAGYSRALVSSHGYMGIVNPSSAAGSAAVRVYVSNGSSNDFSARYHQSAGPGLDLAVSAGRQVDYSGLVGGQVLTIRLTVLGVANWGPVSGGAYLNAFALFTR